MVRPGFEPRPHSLVQASCIYDSSPPTSSTQAFVLFFSAPVTQTSSWLQPMGEGQRRPLADGLLRSSRPLAGVALGVAREGSVISCCPATHRKHELCEPPRGDLSPTYCSAHNTHTPPRPLHHHCPPTPVMSSHALRSNHKERS